MAPEFPTIAESGVTGFDVTGWYSLFVPAKTPPDIIKKMHADSAAALGEPAIKAKFEPLGITVASSSPEALGARVRSEFALWGPIIKSANIKGE